MRSDLFATGPDCAETGWIAGVDEAGRGPLAGPVVVAAVILDPTQAIDGLADSKALSASRREQLAIEIRAHTLSFAICIVEADEIDRLNILGATMAGITCDRPCPAEPCRCCHRSSAGSRSPSAARRSSSDPAPVSRMASPAVACGTNTCSKPSPRPATFAPRGSGPRAARCPRRPVPHIFGKSGRRFQNCVALAL